MDWSAWGTIHDTFEKTVRRWGDRPAYAVPPMAKRSYHPDGVELSWKEIAAEVADLTRRYRAAGYGPGHRVAILMAQRPEFFGHFFALNALGVSVVPVNPDYRDDEIHYLLDHSEAVLAVSIGARADEMRAVAARLSRPCPVVELEAMSDAIPAPALPAGTEKPGAATEAALLYTSGTTGRPKGCVLSNEYFHQFGGTYLELGGLLALREGVERMYNPLPLHHANCLSISTMAMLMTGGCLVFPDRFHASTWWEDIVGCGVTCVQLQGLIPNVLLKLPETEIEKRHQVRFALCAGIEPEHHRVFEARFGFPLVEMWAMTETGRFLPDNEEPRKVDVRSFGRPRINVEARVVDAEDRELPTGAPGELVIRHSEATPRKGFFSGYLKNEAATAEVWRGGWFHTGDVVTRDADGFFVFQDRAKHIIRRSGENIAAAEVEACLVAHPQVRQAAVLPVKDEMRDEEVLAVIVTQAGAEAGPALAADLSRWCLERVAYFKAPAWVVFREELPANTSQKIQKAAIFPPGLDPRELPDIVDLRAMKKPDNSRSVA